MANNPEDEEHHPADRLFEQPDLASSDQPANWNGVEQSTVDKAGPVRPSLRPNLRKPIDDCQQLSKQISTTICDCECCFSNSMQLSSSIVHIDENDSDDEYLDAEAYTTANSTIEDDDVVPERPAGQTGASELVHSNLVNSQNSYTAISSNLYFAGSLSRDEPFENFGSFAHNSDRSELSNPHHPSSQSSCKSNSSLITRTAATLATSTVTSSSSNFSNSNFAESSSQKLNKCHCRLVQASFTAKQRPLSLSSISSSSSSCCSLSRNNSLALSDHLKKPYLASIESLGDDELQNGNVNKFQLGRSGEHSSSSGISSGCHSSGANSSTEPSVHSTCSCCVLRSGSNLSLVRSASTNSNQSVCGCRSANLDHNNLDAYEQDYCSSGANGKPQPSGLIYRSYQHSSMNQQTGGGVHTLSQLDRVIMEIVQTESAYVKDLNEIIEGYFVHLNKKLFEQSELKKKQAQTNRDYDSDAACEEESSTATGFLSTVPSSTNQQQQPNPFVESPKPSAAATGKQGKRNAKQRNKSSKLAFGQLNNGQQFVQPDESSGHPQSITINQTSHTLPKSSKQLSSTVRLRSQSNSLAAGGQLPSKCLPDSMSVEQISDLFGNLTDIYQFNSSFLNQLLQCEFEPVQIAQCFVDNADGFHVYSQYCTNYPKQVETLSELNRNAFTNQLLKIRQIELGHSLPLSAYLLKPVQRILKYHLLLNSMVKHFELEHGQAHGPEHGQEPGDELDASGIGEQPATEPSTQQQSKDAERSLRNALSVMQNMATHINTMKKKHEHAVRVQEIQSLLIGWQGDDLTTFGELVAEADFKLFGNKTLRHLFLFDKMLLVVKKKDDSLLTYKAHILCSNLMLIESIRSEPLCFHAIPFNNPKIQYTFQAKSLDQKREWCLLLKNVILESYHQQIPTHAKQIVLGLGQKASLATENKHKFPVHLNRKLSAPEYLEKRACKAQQKLSNGNLIGQLGSNCSNANHPSLGLQFSSLQKGFKLRKSLKKGVHLIGGRNNNGNSTAQNELNVKKSSIAFNEINENADELRAVQEATQEVAQQLEDPSLISSYEVTRPADHSAFEKEHLIESDADGKLAVSNNISSCLSASSLTTTNDSYTDSGVGSTNSVCCYSQLRLTTPISLGSSIASIESNATTTTANSYSTGYSQLSGSTSSKLAVYQCRNAHHQSADSHHQSSTDDFGELNELNDHEVSIKSAANGMRPNFKSRRCTNRCCDLTNRYGFNSSRLLFDHSPATSLTRFDSKAGTYLHHSSRFYNAAYRQSKYLNLNPDEIDLRPHSTVQVRRVQSFTSGNRTGPNSRLPANYSSCASSNKSFALSGCNGSNSSALLQHTVSFRKSPNVDLVLAKLRHLHRRPYHVAAQKQLYKQQKMQQLKELKLQELSLNGDPTDHESSSKSEEDVKSADDKQLNNGNQPNSIFADDSGHKDDDSSEDEKEDREEKRRPSTRPGKLCKTKDSNSMEELSPTLPAIWLKKHEKNFKDANLKKGGSLPRNFEACL